MLGDYGLCVLFKSTCKGVFGRLVLLALEEQVKQTVEVSLPMIFWAVSLCRPFPAFEEQPAYQTATPHARKMVEHHLGLRIQTLPSFRTLSTCRRCFILVELTG